MLFDLCHKITAGLNKSNLIADEMYSIVTTSANQYPI